MAKPLRGFAQLQPPCYLTKDRLNIDQKGSLSLDQLIDLKEPAVGEYVGQLDWDQLGTQPANVGHVKELQVFKAVQCAGQY